VDLEVTGPASCEQYRQELGPTLEPYGAKTLVRTRDVEVLGGGWRSIQAVVLESADRAGPGNLTAPDGRTTMSEYLPKVYRRFRDEHPEVAEVLDRLGATTEKAGPLDPRTQHLVQLGMAITGQAEGAVRSHARRALDAGATPDELHHVVFLAISTSGFPTAIAGYSWINQVLEHAD
jgi:4-carboxymuconolactone decarboxylase